MDTSKRITLVLCAVLGLVGCSDKEPAKEPSGDIVITDPVGIICLMDRMTNEFFTSETQKGNLNCTRIAKSLHSVTNETMKLQLIDQLLDRILSLDVSRLDYHGQCNSLLSIESAVNDVVLGELYSRRKYSLDDYHELHFDRQIRYLDWLRQQIRRTAPKHRADAQEPSLDDAERERRFWWRRLHYGSISTYESKLSSLESFYHAYARRLSGDSAERIKRKIEEFLGRPIRTSEKIKQDCKAGRRVEFTEKEDPHAAP